MQISIILFFLSIIVLGTIFKIFNRTTFNAMFFGISKVVGVIVVAIMIAVFNPFTVERIDAGHVGIKVNNVGDERGVGRTEYVTGWVVYNNWLSRIYEFPVYQQHIDYEENIVITKGGFQATIKPSFNYALNAGSVGDMFSNLRVGLKEVEQGWLKNAIVSSVNDVANLFTVDSIFNHRAEFERDIVTECNKRVSKWFTVSQLRTNIIPPPEISQSIVEKTKAVQEAQAALQRKIVADAEAQEKIARAKGDSAQAVIQAAGRAQAVRLEQQALTPLYIEFLKIKTWKGDVPQVVGGNSGFLIQLPPKPGEQAK